MTNQLIADDIMVDVLCLNVLYDQKLLLLVALSLVQMDMDVGTDATAYVSLPAAAEP